MGNLEYQDRHRFVASVGVALVALSAILPWLFFREPFDLLIETEKLLNLTATAQATIAYRQSMVQWFMAILPWLSLGLLLLGLLVLFIGLKGWNKKQSMQDRTDAINLANLERQASEMSEEEIKEKRHDSLQENDNKKLVPWKTTDSARASKPERITNSLSPSSGPDALEKYEKIEDQVTARLKEADPKIFELLSQRKVAGRSFDAILARKTSNGPDILIEIKYLTRKPTKNEFYRLLDRQVATTRVYERSTGRRARGVVIAVTSNQDLEKQVRQAWFQPQLELMRKKEGNQVISVLSEGEIAEADFGEIIAGDIQFTNDLEAWDGMHSAKA